MPRRILNCAYIAAVMLVVCPGLASASESEVLHAMKVDSTGLSSTAFFLEGEWFEGEEVETVELGAGSYFLQPGSGLVMRCQLTVTDTGTWAYASECDGFLSGRGTDSLRLLGYTVTIDASPLSTPIYLANLNIGQLGASPRPVTLLPTFADMLASPGPGVIAACGFRIELDGTVGYADEVHGCLTGRGTRTVTVHGVPVNVDARALTTSTFTVLQAYSLEREPSDVVQRFRLLPTLAGYHYGAWTVSGVLWPSLGLTVGLDGRIDYPASADGWVSGRGTDTLVIRGHEVQIDARAVPPNSFHIPDAEALHLGGAVHTLRLAPVSYLYFTGEPTDFRFSIRESDGAIEVPGDAACGRGEGTALIIGCRTVAVEDLVTDEPPAGTAARRTVHVALSEPAPADVTVHYTTADGSATAPGDYEASSETVTIPAGRTGASFLLTVNGDDVAEGDETLTISLSNSRGATIGRASATITIRDASPPDTIITSGPAWESTVATPATFEFVATTPSRFECSLQRWGPDDTTTWEPCSSPYRQPPGGFDYFEFKVRAIDLAGNVDATPAERRYYHDPEAYGNFWIRGIDVFQVVQPNARARMYSYDPNNPEVSQLFPMNCGAGTPTAFRSSVPGIRNCDRLAEDRQRVTYRGVPLDIRKVTYAIVYVGMEGSLSSDPDQPLHVSLKATDPDTGAQIGIRKLRRITNPPASSTPWVTPFERRRALSGRYGVRFPVDASWLNRRNKINLTASVAFAPGTRSWSDAECSSERIQACAGDNTFQLRLVDIAKTFQPAQLVIQPLALRTHAGQTFPPAEDVLAVARHLFPGGERIKLRAYAGTEDVTTEAKVNPGTDACPNPPAPAPPPTVRECRRVAIQAAVDEWTSRNPPRYAGDGGTVVQAYDIFMGVHNYTAPEPTVTPVPPGTSVPPEPGYQWGGTTRDVGATAVSHLPRFTATFAERPITAAAHELAHALTAPHAGHDCPVPVGQPGNLTGPDEPQAGERWFDDRTGRLQGTKFDWRATGDDDPQVDDDLSSPLFDLMSYCANLGDRGLADTPADSGNAWISARNWNRIDRELSALAQRVGTDDRPAAVPAAAATARATAQRSSTGRGFAVGVVGPGGGKIMRVVPPDGQDAIPAPEPSSRVRVRSLGADGRVLLDAGVRVEVSSESSPGSLGSFVAPVSNAADAVELVRDSAVLYRLERSRPPRITLRSARVRSRSLVVRWSATDPDGDPLQAAIDYSPDNGRTWTTVFKGPSRGRTTVPGVHLPGSRRARVRVAINDGFNEARARSAPFRVEGREPEVRIVRPGVDEELRADTRTLLIASASDDRDRPIRGRALSWFAGRKLLGHGSELYARLPRGRFVLRAVARDVSGRRGIARVRLNVAPNRLWLLRLSAPKTVKRRSRSVAVRVAASAPATLKAAGRRYRIGTRTRRIVLPLPHKPTQGAVRVRFTLVPRGGGVVGRVRGRVEVFRGRAAG